MQGILFEQSIAGSQDDPEEAIRNILPREVESVEMGDVEEPLTYGNPKGLSLLDRIAIFEREGKATKASLEREILKTERMTLRLSTVETQNQGLIRSSEGYMHIRRRFIENYKKSTNITKSRKSSAIQQGNIAAHHGDATTDAILFEKESRNDETVYVQLYGLSPKDILAVDTFIISSIWKYQS